MPRLNLLIIIWIEVRGRSQQFIRRPYWVRVNVFVERVVKEGIRVRP